MTLTRNTEMTHTKKSFLLFTHGRQSTNRNPPPEDGKPAWVKIRNKKMTPPKKPSPLDGEGVNRQVDGRGKLEQKRKKKQV